MKSIYEYLPNIYNFRTGICESSFFFVTRQRVCGSQFYICGSAFYTNGVLTQTFRQATKCAIITSNKLQLWPIKMDLLICRPLFDGLFGIFG